MDGSPAAGLDGADPGGAAVGYGTIVPSGAIISSTATARACSLVLIGGLPGRTGISGGRTGWRGRVYGRGGDAGGRKATESDCRR